MNGIDGIYHEIRRAPPQHPNGVIRASWRKKWPRHPRTSFHKEWHIAENWRDNIDARRANCIELHDSPSQTFTKRKAQIPHSLPLCVTVIYFQGREYWDVWRYTRNIDKWPNAIIFLSNTGIYLILQANPKQPSILRYSRISRTKRTAGRIVRVCVNKQCDLVYVHRSAYRCNYRLCLCATSALDLIG